MCIRNILGETHAIFLSSHWPLEKEGGFLLADFQFGASPPALKAARAALCVFKMWRHLLCPLFQCGSSCSVYIMEADKI
jgi:hypothetical protein